MTFQILKENFAYIYKDTKGFIVLIYFFTKSNIKWSKQHRKVQLNKYLNMS